MKKIGKPHDGGRMSGKKKGWGTCLWTGYTPAGKRGKHKQNVKVKRKV